MHVGCAGAEKTQYAEHLTYIVEPSDEPDERVIAAFQRQQPGKAPAVAAADE